VFLHPYAVISHGMVWQMCDSGTGGEATLSEGLASSLATVGAVRGGWEGGVLTTPEEKELRFYGRAFCSMRTDSAVGGFCAEAEMREQFDRRNPALWLCYEEKALIVEAVSDEWWVRLMCQMKQWFRVEVGSKLYRLLLCRCTQVRHGRNTSI